MEEFSVDGEGPAKERQEDTQKCKPRDRSAKPANRQKPNPWKESGRYDATPSSRN